MKTTEKENASASGAPKGGGGSGRGRGFRGEDRGGAVRGGGSNIPSQADGRCDTPAAGGNCRNSGGNHGRHPRYQPCKSPHNSNQQSTQNQGGRGEKGRSRSSSFNSQSTHSTSSISHKKSSGPYTHLFCSERHAFAMSRVFYPQTNNQFLLPLNCKKEMNNIIKVATDEQLEQWWDSVKIVRCFAPFHEDATSAHDSSNGSINNPRSFLDRCPLCLDEEMVSPCIAPCGHTFCLPCVLGYLHSVAKELNAESDRIHKNKHERNVGKRVNIVGASSMTTTTKSNRATVTSVRARCPMCSSGSAFALHVGDATITYKDLRPVVFVPVMSINASTAMTSPIGETKRGGGNNRRKDSRDSNLPLGTRMRFVKLHRIKHCPAPYLPLTGHRVRGGREIISLTAFAMGVAEKQQHPLPDLPDGDDDCEECMYTRQYFVGVKEHENIIQRDLYDLENYREKSVYCQMDPREAWNVSMAIEAIQAAQRRWLGNSNTNEGGFRQMELEAKKAADMRTKSDYLLLPETIDKGPAPSLRKSGSKSTCWLQPGLFHLHQNYSGSKTDECDEFLYYQSADGQHYYLSGLDVACLMHEFSLDCSAENSDVTTAVGHDNGILPPIRITQKSGSTLPLPDEITARIVAVDTCTVTTSLIKRKPFLSHMPLYSSVSFVEIDWSGEKGNQPLLSKSTMSKFRGELQRRKTERLRVAKRDKTVQEVAQAKSEKEERRRRQELLESNYFDEIGCRQTINPGDDFFQVPATPVDVIDKPSKWNNTLTHRFSEAFTKEEMWPELK
jgi:hypothetical protein